MRYEYYYWEVVICWVAKLFEIQPSVMCRIAGHLITTD
jgi:hypothetical protein